MRARGARRMRDTRAVLRTVRWSGVRVTAYAVSAIPGVPASRTLRLARRQGERIPLDDLRGDRLADGLRPGVDVLDGHGGAVRERGARRGRDLVVAVVRDALLGEQAADVGRGGAQAARLPVDGDGHEDGRAVDDGLALGQGAGGVDAQGVVGGAGQVPFGEEVAGSLCAGLDGFGEPVVDEGDVLGGGRCRDGGDLFSDLVGNRTGSERDQQP